MKYNILHNLLFYAQLYNSSAQDIISGSVNRLVNNDTSNLVKYYQLQTASFVREIVLIREGTNRIIKSCKFVSLIIRPVSSSVRFHNKYIDKLHGKLTHQYAINRTRVACFCCY